MISRGISLRSHSSSGRDSECLSLLRAQLAGASAPLPASVVPGFRDCT